VSARELPVLDILLPAAPAAGPRAAPAPDDARVAEFRPEDQALPRFWIWTLGCQMNRSDSEEMAGRLLAAGCAEAPSMDAADLVIINTCAIREAAEAKVIGRQGVLRAFKAENTRMRVVLTGCAVRERDRAGLRRRFPAVDLFLRPDEEPELVERLGLASAQGPVGLAPSVIGGAEHAASVIGGADSTAAAPARSAAAARTGATTVVKGVAVSAADHLAGARADAVGDGAVRRESSVAAWLPIIYGCDKTCTYCIVPFSRGPERSRPFDDVLAEARALAAAGYREVTLLGQNVNSYGHDLPTEERFAHAAEERWAGRRLDRRGRPDLAELIRAIDAISGDDGRPAIPRLRFVTSHPWDLSDRLVEAMAACPSVCEALHLPVQSGDDAVLHRMGRQYTIAHYRERLDRIRAAIPGITISTDVIVGFCGETDDQYRATLELLRAVRYDQVFAAAYSPRPGTPATRLPDDVPAAVKRERLNGLLAVQEEIGFARNRERLGSTVSVLVDAVARPRAHDHDAGAPGERVRPPAGLVGEDPFEVALAPGWVRLFGRSRENKLVHMPGPPELVGRIVDARVVGAGPYSLRGVPA
jgi:tRNA-2-methylthio-N6-dimethylallyladenosine synthase